MDATGNEGKAELIDSALMENVSPQVDDSRNTKDEPTKINSI